jgi:hypothetical protein
MKFLIALQFWHGDRDQAMKLARLITDLSPNRVDLADFLFVSRFDTKHDLATEKYLSRRFNTHSITCRRRRGTGWPHGCNDLWFGTLDWIYTMREAKKIPQYKAVFTIEADGCPLVPNWLHDVTASWDRANTGKKVYVHGAMLMAPGIHINGNALFSCDPKFLHHITRRIAGCSPAGGWDYLLSPVFQKWGWENCPAIRSYWRAGSIDETAFNREVAQGVSYLHGIKDSSAFVICRKKYNLPPV